MSETRKSILADLTVGMMIAFAVYLLNQSRESGLMHKLCDCFFVAAVALLGSGGIRFCTSRGALDMLGYGFKTVGEFFTKAGRLDGPDEDYFTYCQRKAEERKPFGHFLIAGALYLVLSVIFLIANMVIGA